ncbi:hydroxyacylglutathione hydrolase [Rhodovarius crocodyli]|uniref:Hydroxyacylglutathione hydrolase n=1 Tax=Rhodovarius crocodyli TaxID=1979269 RepID=A0A437MNP5_9PROT|nr:hydroxyacylglutathione hydrolase [Rhodovarius crocodyli]RVT99275.1 hydroxyacylglutathione hydrolase [Rhodovarius crocodyli]
MSVSVLPIPHQSDNYAWFLKDAETGTTAVVDPGEAQPIIDFVNAHGGKLDWIIITHHHGDHINGVEGVRAAFGAKVMGAKADAHRLPKLDLELAEGDSPMLGKTKGQVFDTPGHTRGHISLLFGDVLLCADTLFSAGCGRLLEGTAQEMFDSLQKLAKLPGETLVCCGHEYTESNIRFALTVEPENEALQARAKEAAALRRIGEPTVPTTLTQELTFNPFLRAKTAARLAEIRTGKDNFRG